MNLEELKATWVKEEAQLFRGWDFSYLKGRWEDEALPWDYAALVQAYREDNMKLLDMGTGGGEFLLSLGHPYGLTTVTEAYQPNIDLCLKTLAPLGINVVGVEEDSNLAIENDFLDLVINRHESYDPEELGRILKSKGIFITQQIGCKNNEQMSKFLIPGFESEFPEQRVEAAEKKLEAAGFEILRAEEYYPYLRFYDVGALVYFAKIIEWEFPGFTVENSFHKLLELHRRIEAQGLIESLEHRYLIIARKK